MRIPLRADRHSIGRTAILAALIVMLLSAPASAQKFELEIDNIQFGFAGFMKPGRWLPAAVTATTKNGNFNGQIEFFTNDTDGLSTRIAREVYLDKNDTQTFQHFVKFGAAENEIVVDFRDGKGVADERTFEPSQAASNRLAIPLDPLDRLAVVLGRQAGLVDRGDEFKTSDLLKIASLRSAVALPTQWIAYDSADVFILGTSDEALLGRIDPARAAALTTWVRQGGKLVVSVADNWQLVRESFLGPMLPAQLTGLGRLRVPDVIETFAKSKKRFDVGPQGLPIAETTSLTGKSLVSRQSVPLVVNGSYGLGEVTLVLFDTDAPLFAQWIGRHDFWNAVLGLPAEDEFNAEQMNQLRSRSFNQYGENQELAVALNSILDHFPDVTLVPFGLVALLILGYIILIGPVDYFFLKKVVGRLEWTWVTFPTIVVVVSLGAYYAAHKLKGDELRINRVEFVDVDAATGTLRGSCYSALFSPRIAEYTLAMTPGLAADGTWADLGMSKQQSTRLADWLAEPSNDFRGMGRQSGIGLVGRGRYGYQSPNADAVLNVPVKIWSVKRFAHRWLAKAGPTLEHDLRAHDGLLEGKITNRLKVALKDVFVAYGERIHELSELPPGGTVDLGNVTGKHLSVSSLRRFDRDDYRSFVTSVDGLADRLTFGEHAERNQKTATVRNQSLAELDLSHLLSAGKVVVVASVEGPGGKLWLDELPDVVKVGEPKVVDGVMRYNTYLRVVLEPTEKK